MSEIQATNIPFAMYVGFNLFVKDNKVQQFAKLLVLDVIYVYKFAKSETRFVIYDSSRFETDCFGIKPIVRAPDEL